MDRNGFERMYDFYEDLAADYLRKARQQIPAYETLFQMADCLLDRELSTFAEVLVVGGGGGQEICSIGLDKDWRMTVVDPSEQMCLAAKARAEEAGIAGRCEIRAEAVSDLPDAEVFDAATCILVMHFLSKERQADLLDAISRRLKPGALLVAAHLVARDDPDEHRWMMEFWSDTLVRLGEDPERVAKQIQDLEHEVTMLREDEFLELCEAAGLEYQARISQTLHFTQWALRKAE
ncbi:MAG TPA: class I SAM-dependent methyltransferase [Fibrobacteria bacterium]|nr:class I SAM-dependent methyltransferase [Fibrobacteria bacterium]